MLSKVYWGNSLQAWVTALVILGVSIIVARAVGWLFRKLKSFTSNTKFRFDDLIIDMIEEPIVLILQLAGFRLAFATLKLPETLVEWIDKGIHIVMALLVGWMVARLLDSFIETYAKPYVEATDSDFDDQLLPVVKKALKIVVWGIAIIVGMNNAGYDVGALIAGLGIGGLAFALAAKDSLSNLFGGFTIYADRTFGVNDRIKVAGFDGTVVEIGLRSTRLKTLEGRLVTIPNAAFTDKPVENVSSEPTRKVVLNLGLTYDTQPAAIDKALSILQDIAAKNEGVDEGTLASFSGFGDFALNILFIYYIKKDANILDTNTAVNREILSQFNANKLEFAFPTQTIHTIAP